MARPRYQQGYVRLRGDQYELRYREDFLNAEGKLYRQHRSVILGAFRNKKEARRAAEIYLRPFNHSARRPQLTITMSDFWFNHFEPEILPNLKFSTRSLYQSLARTHLLPFWGERKLYQATQPEVQQFIGLKRRAGYSTKTLEHLRNLLSKIFSTAVSWKWIEGNPAQGIQLPPRQATRQPHILTPAELARLLAELREPARTLLLLGVTSGLRIGELLALKTTDIDFAGTSLFVRRAIYRGELGTPKSRRSERRIPLAGMMAKALEHYLETQRRDCEWLFPSEAGTPLDDRNLLRREVEPAVKKLGITHFSWHSLRHTFRTIAGNHGVPPELVQSLLGHASMETTMLYFHRVDEAERRAVEKVAEVLCLIVPESNPEEGKLDKLIQ